MKTVAAFALVIASTLTATPVANAVTKPPTPVTCPDDACCANTPFTTPTTNCDCKPGNYCPIVR